MNPIKSLGNKLTGLIDALNRYPFAVFLLLAAAVVNADMINSTAGSHLKYLLTFLIGALISAVVQHIHERFFTGIYVRLLLTGFVVVLTAGYYFAIGAGGNFDVEMNTKTAVALLALLMAFIWVPSIKNRITFNQSFMAAFKAFFTVVLFSAVIAIGLNAILFAVDQLLNSLDSKIYSHVLNIIFTLCAPLFFLSLIPRYPNNKDINRKQQEEMNRAITCPKTLDVLISYIIIPLTSIYTIVLLTYVLINIQEDFWTNNLLEPMLVSYAIIVIFVYILASNLNNPFTSIFKKVFPKVLIPIVLFQTFASIIKVGEMGLTHGRYYVILFGLFAVIAAVIFSFFSTVKNGWVAAVLIVAAAVSIIPPVDAFTWSRTSQIHLLEETLVDNGMVDDKKIVPKSDIPTKDKETITSTVYYLEDMHDINQIDWLPNNVIYGENFKKTFGFDETKEETGEAVDDSQFVNLDTTSNFTLDIGGYDRMVRLVIDDGAEAAIPMKINGAKYQLKKEVDDRNIYLTLADDHDQELLKFNAKEAFNDILQEGEKGSLTVDEARVTDANDEARISIVADSIDYNDGNYNADLYVLLEIK